jgi:streptogramin lyase
VRAGSVRRVRLGGAPISLAFAFGKLWVAQRDANRVITIDPQSLTTLSAAGVPVPVSIVAGSLGAWALSLDAGALYELYPSSGKFVTRVYAPVADPVDMLAAGGELWILGAAEHGLSPFNALLVRVVRAGIVRPGVALGGLSSAGSTLWVSEPAAHSLLRVDTRAVTVRQFPAPGGIAPAATAVGACGVWVADGAGKLELVDPETARAVTPPLRVGASIAALAPVEATGSGRARGVWVTDPLDGTVSLVDLAPSG